MEENTNNGKCAYLEMLILIPSVPGQLYKNIVIFHAVKAGKYAQNKVFQKIENTLEYFTVEMGRKQKAIEKC